MRNLLLTVCLLFVGTLQAQSDEQAVDAFLSAVDGIKALEGRFVQQQFDQSGAPMGETSGSFRLLRPAYFLWNIEAPDRQQVIAGPDYVWHHDLDLETVTRRPVSSQGDMAPLQILGGDETLLRKRFEVSQLDVGHFLLQPREPGSGFKEVTVTLEEGMLATMEIKDELRQRILVTFSEVSADVELGAADFSFAPPEGGDVFYYDQ